MSCESGKPLAASCVSRTEEIGCKNNIFVPCFSVGGFFVVVNYLAFEVWTKYSKIANKIKNTLYMLTIKPN